MTLLCQCYIMCIEYLLMFRCSALDSQDRLNMEKQAPLQGQHLKLRVLNRLGSSQRQTDFNGNHVAFLSEMLA